MHQRFIQIEHQALEVSAPLWRRPKHAILHGLFPGGSLLRHFHVASLGFGPVFRRTLSLSGNLALWSLG